MKSPLLWLTWRLQPELAGDFFKPSNQTVHGYGHPTLAYNGLPCCRNQGRAYKSMWPTRLERVRNIIDVHGRGESSFHPARHCDYYLLMLIHSMSTLCCVWRKKKQKREVEGRQNATGRKSEDLEERRMCESWYMMMMSGTSTKIRQCESVKWAISSSRIIPSKIRGHCYLYVEPLIQMHTNIWFD